MRFFDYTGKLVPGRRKPQGKVLSATDLEDKSKIAEALKEVTQRLSELEAIVGGEAVEFEVTLPASGIVRLNHGFGSPVRWYHVWSEDTSTTTSTVSQSTNVTGVTQDAAAAVAYKFNFDFTALTLGKYTAGNFLTATAVGNTAGLVFTRADVSTVQTSASTLDETPGVDEACIGNRTATASKTGLVIQSKVKQFVGNGAANTDEPRNIGRVEANGWSAGLNATITFPTVASPNVANTGCSRVVTLNNGFSPFAAAGGGVGLTTWTSWQRTTPTTGTSSQMISNDGVISANDKAANSNSSTWGRLIILKGTLAATAHAVVDSRDYTACGGEANKARDVYVDYAMLEHGNFPNEAVAVSGGTRAGDRLSYATGSQLIASDGQIKMYAKFSPKFSTTDQVNYTSATTAAYSAGAYLFSWGALSATPADYAYIKDSDKKLYVKLAGGTEVVSALPIAWTKYDVVEIYLAVGAGLPSVYKYRLNGVTVWNDLVLPIVSDTPAPGSSAVSLFLNSVIVHASGQNDTGHMPMWLHQLSFYNTGAPSGVAATTYTSGTTAVNTSSTRSHSPDVTVNRANTTLNTLALNSYNAIKTVIRVESQPATVSPPLAGV